MSKGFFVLLLACADALVATAVAQAPAPIVSARIGDNTEGATLITAGPFPEQVALLDGYDVIPGQPGTLLATDEHGRPLPPRRSRIQAGSDASVFYETVVYLATAKESCRHAYRSAPIR